MLLFKSVYFGHSFDLAQANLHWTGIYTVKTTDRGGYTFGRQLAADDHLRADNIAVIQETGGKTALGIKRKLYGQTSSSIMDDISLDHPYRLRLNISDRILQK